MKEFKKPKGKPQVKEKVSISPFDRVFPELNTAELNEFMYLDMTSQSGNKMVLGKLREFQDRMIAKYLPLIS